MYRAIEKEYSKTTQHIYVSSHMHKKVNESSAAHRHPKTPKGVNLYVFDLCNSCRQCIQSKDRLWFIPPPSALIFPTWENRKSPERKRPLFGSEITDKAFQSTFRRYRLLRAAASALGIIESVVTSIWTVSVTWVKRNRTGDSPDWLRHQVRSEKRTRNSRTTVRGFSCGTRCFPELSPVGNHPAAKNSL